MRSLMARAFVLFAICFYCCEVNALVCPENICAKMHCERVDESICSGEDKLIKKGGFCECCDTCFNVVGSGEFCGLPIFGFPPSSILCKEGLQCIGGFCVENYGSKIDVF